MNETVLDFIAQRNLENSMKMTESNLEPTKRNVVKSVIMSETGLCITHKNKVLLKCQYCLKMYIGKDKLDQHVRTKHVGESVGQCDICH